MPGEAELPDGLKKLAYRHAAEVRSGRDFRHHVDRLIGGIEQAAKPPPMDNPERLEVPLKRGGKLMLDFVHPQRHVLDGLPQKRARRRHQAL